MSICARSERLCAAGKTKAYRRYQPTKRSRKSLPCAPERKTWTSSRKRIGKRAREFTRSTRSIFCSRFAVRSAGEIAAAANASHSEAATEERYRRSAAKKQPREHAEDKK